MNRRDALRVLAALVAGGAASLAHAGPRVLAVRAWPGKESTRITIESDSELRFFVSSLANPDRTVIDISDVQADAAFQKALETLKNDTGILSRARIGQYRADTARLVLELKSRAESAAFALPPVGPYNHRLVIDLTATDADDPIATFLAKLIERETQLEKAQAERDAAIAAQPPLLPPKPSVLPPVLPAPTRRPSLPPHIKPFVVVLDPGHGGEDPGAIGPGGTYEKNVVLAIAHKTRQLLEQDSRVVVFMTREEDVFIPLGERVRKARSVHADVFVSSMPMRLRGRTLAAARSSRCRIAAPAARRRSGSPTRKTSPT